MNIDRNYNSWGFITSIAATVLSLTFTAFAFSTPTAAWEGIESYAALFSIISIAADIPVFFLPFCYAIIAVALVLKKDKTKDLFGILGILFAVPYIVLICTNYHIQLTIVRHNIESGTLEGLGLFAMTNFHSFFTSLEGLGYFFMGASTFFLAFLFGGRSIESWLRWLFLINAMLGLIGLIATWLDLVLVIFVFLGVWSASFPLTAVLLAFYFKKEK